MADPDAPEPLARTALLLGLVPFVGIAALWIGFVARRRARRELRPGAGAALVGMCFGALWLIVLAVIGAAAGVSHAHRDATGEVAVAESISVDELHVGDCLESAVQEHDTEASVTPCSTPHYGEVYSYSALPAQSRPDDIVARAKKQCELALNSYVSGGDYSYDAYWPTPFAWGAGEHRILCIVTAADGSPLTGSVNVARVGT